MGTCCVKIIKPQTAAASTEESNHLTPRTPRALQRMKSVRNPRSRRDPYRELPTALRVQRPQSSSDAVLIRSALLQYSFFNESQEELLQVISSAMNCYEASQDELVYLEGEMPQFFLVLQTGAVELRIRGETLRFVYPGEHFGQESFLAEQPRKTTAVTTASTTFWAIHRTAFDTLLQRLETEQAREIFQFLEKSAVFTGLSPKDIRTLPHIMKMNHYAENSLIVQQGAAGTSCFLVKSGVVSCSQDGVEIRRLGAGELFGEQALLYGGVRTATVKAVTKVAAWTIESSDLTSVLGDRLEWMVYKNTVRIAFDRSRLLSRLNERQREKVVSRMHFVSRLTGQTAIPHKTDDPTLWVVLDGFLEARDNRETVLQAFSVIGDQEDTWGKSRVVEHEYIVGSDSAAVASISIPVLERRLGGPIQSSIGVSPTVPSLMHIWLFLGLSIERLDSLKKSATVRSFSQGQTIITEGDSGSVLYIIQSGEVAVSQSENHIRTLGVRDYFGERTILLKGKRTATVKASTDVTCWLFGKAAILPTLKEGVYDRLKRRLDLQDDPTSLSDLVVMKLIDKGVFGLVFLAVHRAALTFYVVRVVPNSGLSAEGIETLSQEKEILGLVYHPFLLQHIRTFDDSSFTYFLSVFINGTDLFEVLRDFGRVLCDSEAKFYIACLTLAIEYLHSNRILYRNIKPENILIDDTGYPMLVDMNNAKILRSEKTFTILGVPHYLAPEVVRRKGYSFASDYWSLGVILYESLCGQVPFGESETSPFKVYEQILACELSFPESSLANVTQAKDVIVSLLNPNPALRLHGSLTKFRKHPWFKGISWIALLCRQEKPPYIPKVKNFKAYIPQALAKDETVLRALSKELTARHYSRIRPKSGNLSHLETFSLS